MSQDSTSGMNRIRMIRPKLSRLELKERFHRRRFLVPNAVTLCNMFCGFLAIIYASAHHFEKAVYAIAIAIVLDGLDGRVARRLKATSKFGVEFDSFSDLVSFGLAPALLVYHWSFQPHADELGVPISFVYALCAASRLARFNIQAENLKGFTGLPTPGAAGFVAAYVNCIPTASISIYRTIFDACLMVGLAALMVSKIEFLSIKKVRISGAGLFLLLGVCIAMLWYYNQVGFLCLAGGYVLSGPAIWAGQRLGMLRRPPQAELRGPDSQNAS
ncbi:MAG: CDP-diacylglycerol--serine O-phosphatidyltransferase [Proteobacteria bacterium]|nr:CDP-diacylglycerol--serine O-phosphatidyltransferase [Pseudomonadota bacterium]